ncbi:hypothetical protein SDC9_211230 [bioreactor metagenome]|uniref:Uncharacterized protein n=1 Tax=bioreactor metagenome TaxID=1076179 RepID=A0A645JIN5_9ZZZZ
MLSVILQRFTQLAQAHVTGGMPVFIIKILEVIDIDHHDPAWLLRLRRIQSRQGFKQFAAVIQSCQYIRFLFNDQKTSCLKTFQTDLYQCFP